MPRLCSDPVLTMCAGVPWAARRWPKTAQPFTTPMTFTSSTLVTHIHEPGPGRHHAGVVHHDVDVAELRPRALGEVLHRSTIGDVAADGPGPDRTGPDFTRRTMCSSEVDVGDDDVDAACGKRSRDTETDSTGAAGHDGDLACEVLHDE